ncbi:MAG TPA: ferritin family protein [Elusimicrobiales bacterium]|nr:ferritin family protein [Elusimicrobiales bacterium]
MKLYYSQEEAPQLAVRIEDRGADFYRKAAAGSRDPETAALFVKLAEYETEHGKYFLSLLDEKYPDFAPGPTAGELMALADTAVFPEKPEDMPATPGEALKLAIGLEKDSVLFYLGLKEAVNDPAGADGIGRIIREEMSHISALSALLKKK